VKTMRRKRNMLLATAVEKIAVVAAAAAGAAVTEVAMFSSDLALLRKERTWKARKKIVQRRAPKQLQLQIISAPLKTWLPTYGTPSLIRQGMAAAAAAAAVEEKMILCRLQFWSAL